MWRGPETIWREKEWPSLLQPSCHPGQDTKHVNGAFWETSDTTEKSPIAYYQVTQLMSHEALESPN